MTGITGMTRLVDDLEISALWLRDACTCSECRHEGSGQRLHSVLSVDPATTVVTSRVDGDEVEITFAPDGHIGRYSLSWLQQHAPGRGPVFDDRTEQWRTPWVAADLQVGPPSVTWADLTADGFARADALRQLFDLGLLLVRGVPVAEGSVLDVARSFGFVRTTNYGDLFDVRVEPQPTNLAYTGRGIAPHTDNPYREPVPGIQLLHCLSSSASGGENVLIDGFSAAALVRADDPAAFSTLAHTPLTFRFDDAHTALRASGPVIETNSVGAVRGIRWNDRSVEPPQVEPDRVDEVYRALRVFAAVLGRTELHLHLKLEPGDCIVFDNTRILHARTAFADGSARRHLQGCYADLDGLASTVSVHERRAIDAIERVFTSAAGLAYLGENVTMIQHQLQAGALALAAGSADALVVASLLHDVGHMVGHHVGELEATAALDEDADAHHDASGARWLAQWFGQDVTEPVRLHVAAKRFLVATEPAYAALLSPASVHTLQLQGGPMSTAEVDAFRTSPYAADAVALRRFDEAAKDPGSEAPSLVAHRELIRRVLNGGHRG